MQHSVISTPEPCIFLRSGCADETIQEYKQELDTGRACNNNSKFITLGIFPEESGKELAE
jgi:hypothetical protein